MTDQQFIIALLGAIGGPTVLIPLARGILRWLSGAQGRERIKHRDQKQRLEDETERADRADAYRRVIAEHASTLIGILNQHGLGHLVPPWPRNPNEETQQK